MAKPVLGRATCDSHTIVMTGFGAIESVQVTVWVKTELRRHLDLAPSLPAQPEKLKQLFEIFV
ncbi:hypothetical protein [Saccharospirillum alexandrii]|uniref:hypothetical protein n=1 Tax=Saccharospirillum alexandrii TaxID=2448477 RepID=UPI00373584FC